MSDFKSMREMLLELGWEPPTSQIDIWRPPKGSRLRANWERWPPMTEAEFEEWKKLPENQDDNRTTNETDRENS